MADSNAGGYECEFVDPVKHFLCPLCLYMTRDPNLTSCCGQHFCQVCIQTNYQPCPFCKDTKFTVLLDKKQKRKVLELKVYCTIKEQGCSWTGELVVWAPIWMTVSMLLSHVPRGVESPFKGVVWLLTLQNHVSKEISSVSIVVSSVT